MLIRFTLKWVSLLQLVVGVFVVLGGGRVLKG